MKAKFFASVCFGLLWLTVSLLLAIGWGREASRFLPAVYVWWVIVGIALLPGFLMSTMLCSNLLHWRLLRCPVTTQDTTILMCARNEEKTIADSIHSILQQEYQGHIRLLVIDNCSTDHTKQEILRLARQSTAGCTVEYCFCAQAGKACALNKGLSLVDTPYFLTVDADTHLHRCAVQNIMDHIVSQHSACTAGNLFVRNAKESLATRMQTYDYLLSIAAVKRFQGSYRSTLVAQGAFSAYQTQAVRELGGWQDSLGEDIVLTYQLLERGLPSTYEPTAVGYTTVPQTIRELYHQRRRWAIGMFEGLSAVAPWKQGNLFSRFFACVNLSIVDLDLAYFFGFLPGVVLALFGRFWFVGVLTLVTLAVCILIFLNIYLYQKKLGIPFEDSLPGFVLFLLFFQLLQSTSSLHGYLCHLLHKKGSW